MFTVIIVVFTVIIVAFVKTDSGLSAYCHGNADFAGAMLANHHNPYIQRGYRPFVIHNSLNGLKQFCSVFTIDPITKEELYNSVEGFQPDSKTSSVVL